MACWQRGVIQPLCDQKTQRHEIRPVMTGLEIDILACPACYGDLAIVGDSLQCQGCYNTYPIVNGIPRLLVSEKPSEALAEEQEWWGIPTPE